MPNSKPSLKNFKITPSFIPIFYLIKQELVRSQILQKYPPQLEKISITRPRNTIWHPEAVFEVQ